MCQGEGEFEGKNIQPKSLMPTPDPYEHNYHDYCSPLQRAIYERNMFQDEHDRRKEQIEKEMVERFEDTNSFVNVTKKHRKHGQ